MPAQTTVQGRTGWYAARSWRTERAASEAGKRTGRNGLFAPWGCPDGRLATVTLPMMRLRPKSGRVRSGAFSTRYKISSNRSNAETWRARLGRSEERCRSVAVGLARILPGAGRRLMVASQLRLATDLWALPQNPEGDSESRLRAPSSSEHKEVRTARPDEEH